uniref:G_PROTEIN_RECEP_F2_4 domain-containing protein n=1 Tax=Macrostomum lignano TaxID=282301 RepID=A0A1I8G7Q9_9PLAT
MLAQTLLHLLLASREIVLSRAAGSPAASSLKALPYLCILLKCIWETTRTSIFAWMLAEGINIHDRIAVTVFQTNTGMWRNYLLGYGLPVVPTIVWSGVILWHNEHNPNKCWKESFFSNFYWILSACRIFTFAINIGFLLNVLRVLVMRLREIRSNETQQMRKALRAAFLLLPLLGITNVICTVPDPVKTVNFIVVTTLKSCLLSFQGLFLALMYCFLDKEVQATLSRLLARHRLRRSRTPGSACSAGGVVGGGIGSAGGSTSRRGNGKETIADEAGLQLTATAAICHTAGVQSPAD